MTFVRILLATIVLALAAGDVACAQAYPTRPIKIVVPAGPGGPTDVLARLVGEHMQQTLGQSVIIENRGGGGGAIGAKAVATADPDGYTLLLGNTATLANIPVFSPNAGYDPIKGFAPVAKITDSYHVMVIGPDLPVKSVAELVAYAKARPGTLNFASAGTGNLTHLSGELFKLRTGLDIVHVPYKSSSEAATALLSGQAHITFANIQTLLPLVQDGKARALAVTGATRALELPDVPTMMEAGVLDYLVTSFFGIVAPAGTPADIVARLNSVISGWLASADARSTFKKIGADPAIATPAEFAAFIAAEVAKWSAVAHSAGLKIN